MKKDHFKALLTTSLFIVSASGLAQIPEGYYSSLKGKKGAELKTAIHNIIKNAKVLDYGSGQNKTWWGFYATDMDDEGYVIDRYSNIKVKFGGRGEVADGKNIEHSFPKSWWGGSTRQAYKDLFNLMPSDSKANSSKSNYGMGIVQGNPSYDNGCIKVGNGTEGFKVWQPSNQWKGDFARGYMYMATAYQDYTWENSEALHSLQQGSYPTLKKWAYELYIKWAKEDAVDNTEIKRNNEVCKIQGNRNPYIDFPNLMEYVWGDSVDYAFDPATTMKSSDYNGGSGENPDEPTETTLYSYRFTAESGNCTSETMIQPSTVDEVWTRNTTYGWTATSYNSSTKKRSEADATLYTPEIDLTNIQSATMDIEHAVNFISTSTPAQMLEITVIHDGTKTALDGDFWPEGNSWTFKKANGIDLSLFCGKKIRIGFRYTSTSSIACTWEIRSMTVKGFTKSTGIESAEMDIDTAKPYDIYTIDGKKLNGNSPYKGIVIMRQNGKSRKAVMNN